MEFYLYFYVCLKCFFFQFSSVPQLCLTRDPMDYSMPGFPVHHQRPELAQTHVHQVSDAIQPSHPVEDRIKHLNSAE